MEKGNFNDEFEALDELHKNELDDIVLKKYEKKEKIKKYAIIAGSLLAVFFIVVMVVKVISDSSSAPQDSLVEEKIAQEESTQNDNQEFEEVPVVSEDENESENLNSVIQEVLNKEKNLAIKEKQQQASTPAQIVAKSSTKEIATPKVEKPKKQKITAAVKKPSLISNKKAIKKIKTVTPIGHYYIQVGAFLKYDPDKKFLRKIKSHGFSYKIKTFRKNGQTIKRVYVGPFQNKNEAKRVLGKVHKTISSGAFIVRL